MGQSFNANKAQEELIKAASLAMNVIKDRVFDGLTREVNQVVAQTAATKKDGKYFYEPMQESIEKVRETSMSVDDDMISFQYGMDFNGGDSERKKVIWSVMTEGNLHNPSTPDMGKNFKGGHIYTKPGQLVWNKGIQAKVPSESNRVHEKPNLDYGGTGRTYEDVVENAIKESCGSSPEYGIARDIISSYMNNILRLQISVS